MLPTDSVEGRSIQALGVRAASANQTRAEIASPLRSLSTRRSFHQLHPGDGVALVKERKTRRRLAIRGLGLDHQGRPVFLHHDEIDFLTVLGAQVAKISSIPSRFSSKNRCFCRQPATMFSNRFPSSPFTNPASCHQRSYLRTHATVWFDSGSKPIGALVLQAPPNPVALPIPIAGPE